MALGKTKHAIPDLTSVLELRPDFKQAKDQRGGIYLKQGKYDLAEIDYKDDAAKRNQIQVSLKPYGMGHTKLLIYFYFGG